MKLKTELVNYLMPSNFNKDKISFVKPIFLNKNKMSWYNTYKINDFGNNMYRSQFIILKKKYYKKLADDFPSTKIELTTEGFFMIFVKDEFYHGNPVDLIKKIYSVHKEKDLLKLDINHTILKFMLNNSLFKELIDKYFSFLNKDSFIKIILEIYNDDSFFISDKEKLLIYLESEPNNYKLQNVKFLKELNENDILLLSNKLDESENKKNILRILKDWNGIVEEKENSDVISYGEFSSQVPEINQFL